MKHIHYLYIAAFTFLIACSSEERITTDSNEDPSGPIELSAGIVEGNTKATTRTDPSYQALNANTKLALQVCGTWTGHDPEAVVKTTTATIGDVSGTNNAVNFTAAETLYWDDYGSADPANAITGRTTGLTIYGATVDGKTTATAAGINGLLNNDANWAALSWTLSSDQTTSGNIPADKDLLISNNVSGTTYNTAYDGNYRFGQRNNGKLLKFTHALSKITVVLTAGDGVVDKNDDASLDFANDPEVKLTSNDASTSNPEWACTKGNVNITSGGVTLTGTSPSGDPAVITMWQASSTGHVVTKEALVMPGSQFTGDDAIIARINADGNIYYVTAQKIRAAINLENPSNTDYKTEAGKNYIINVTVNKTDIEVTATVANWTDVTAAVVEPVINVSGDLGGSANVSSDNTFSFYRSTSLNNGYSTKTGDYYGEESVLTYTASSTTWSMSPTLYWPNHNTHYQFRAVWPETVTTEGDGVLTFPRVEDGTGTSSGYQVIKVKNVAYSAGSFPSDLMIARPNVENAAGNCGSNESNEVHPKKNLYTEGICARTGSIDLTFDYMMSQVEVNLSTSDGSDQVRLTGAVVEIVNVYNTGDVKLGDRGVIQTGSIGSYTLDPVGDSNKRWSAIVPQSFTYDANHPLADGNTKFRITITNSDSTTDIYYADIYPILESGKSTRVAPNGKWESGVHYVYNLKLSKTEIKVTASLANWTTVTASQDIWF